MALTFDPASSEYATVAHSTDLDAAIGSGQSIAFWMAHNHSTGDNVGVLEKAATDSTARGWIIILFGRDAGELNIEFHHHDDVGTTSKRLIAYTDTDYSGDTAEHHYLLTYDGGTALSSTKIYVDGISQTMKVLAGYDDLSGGSSLANTETLKVSNRSGIDKLDGTLWDLRVYDRVLSADEALTIATARGADGIVDGLMMRLPMLEGGDGSAASGSDTIKDWSGNGHHATPTNTPTYAAAAMRLH